MDPKLQERLLNLIRLRAKWILLSFLVTLPVAIVLARRASVPYLAEMRVFVDAPRLSDSSDVSPGEGLEQIGRDKIIATQKGLIDSYNVFKYVKSKMDAPNKRSRIGMIIFKVKAKLKRLIIGNTPTDETSDPEYLAFQKSVSFRADAAGGYLTIGYSDRDPALAVRMTELVYEGLVEFQREMQAAQKERVGKYIEKKLAEARENLSQVNIEINNFIASQGLPPNEAGTTGGYKNLSSLQLDLSKAEVELRDRQVRAATAKAAVDAMAATAGNGGGGERMGSPRSAVAADEIKELEKALLSRNAQENPRLRADLKKRLKVLYGILAKGAKNNGKFSSLAMQRNMDEQLREILHAEAQVNVAQQRYDSIKAELDKMEASLKLQPKLGAEYQKLLIKQTHFSKLIDTMTKYYVGLLARNDETFSRLVAVSKPLVNEGSTIRKKWLIFAMFWFALALGLGGLPIVKDVWDEVIVAAFQLTELPLLGYQGVFPRISAKKKEATITDELEGNISVTAFAKKLRASLPVRPDQGNVLVLYGNASRQDRALFALGLSGGLAKNGASVLLINSSWAKKDYLRKIYPKNKRRYRASKSLKDLLDYLADAGKTAVTKASVLFISLHHQEGPPNKEAPTIPAQLKKWVLGTRPYFDYVIVDTGGAEEKEVQTLAAEGVVFLFACVEGQTSLKNIKALIRNLGILDFKTLKFRSALIAKKLKGDSGSSQSLTVPAVHAAAAPPPEPQARTKPKIVAAAPPPEPEIQQFEEVPEGDEEPAASPRNADIEDEEPEEEERAQTKSGVPPPLRKGGKR